MVVGSISVAPFGGYIEKSIEDKKNIFNKKNLITAPLPHQPYQLYQSNYYYNREVQFLQDSF